MRIAFRLAPACLLAGGLLFAAACDSAPVSPLEPPAEAAGPTTLAAIPPSSASLARSTPAPVIEAGPAIGASEVKSINPRLLDQIFLLDDPFGTLVGNAYSFDAKRDLNGKATGTFVFTAVYKRTKVKLAGTIVCFTVTGNTARVGAVVTSSNFASIPVGTTETWSVTDNDWPASWRYDTASTLMGGDAGYALGYCANGLPYTERPVIGGALGIVP